MDNEKMPYTPEHIRLLTILKDVAKHKKTIGYTELLSRARVSLDMSVPFDRGQLGHLLGEISWNETRDGRPMLSSVAIHAGDSLQGQGFFDLAEEIYGKRFRNMDDKLKFGMDELNKTYAYWSEH